MTGSISSYFNFMCYGLSGVPQDLKAEEITRKLTAPAAEEEPFAVEERPDNRPWVKIQQEKVQSSEKLPFSFICHHLIVVKLITSEQQFFEKTKKTWFKYALASGVMALGSAVASAFFAFRVWRCISHSISLISALALAILSYLSLTRAQAARSYSTSLDDALTNAMTKSLFLIPSFREKVFKEGLEHFEESKDILHLSIRKNAPKLLTQNEKNLLLIDYVERKLEWIKTKEGLNTFVKNPKTINLSSAATVVCYPTENQHWKALQGDLKKVNALLETQDRIFKETDIEETYKQMHEEAGLSAIFDGLSNNSQSTIGKRFASVFFTRSKKFHEEFSAKFYAEYHKAALAYVVEDFLKKVDECKNNYLRYDDFNTLYKDKLSSVVLKAEISSICSSNKKIFPLKDDFNDYIKNISKLLTNISPSVKSSVEEVLNKAWY